MQSLRSCSNKELVHSLGRLVGQERELLSEILLHVQEIHRRRLYLELGYPSMFSYMTEHLKYSPGSAMRRLDAAKLAEQIPEVLQDLESGNINLSQVSMLEQSARQLQKMNPQRSLHPNEKKEILKNLACKTKSQSEIVIAQALGVIPKIETSTTHQADESVNIAMTFSKEEWSEIQEMRSHLSNATGGGLKETFLHIARKVIRQRTIQRKPAIKTKDQFTCSQSQSEDPIKSDSAAESMAHRDRVSVPIATRKHLLQKFASCQYRHTKTGKVCGSKNFLVIEHLQPVWAGGENQIENLSVLCSAHNHHRYRQQAGLADR